MRAWLKESGIDRRLFSAKMKSSKNIANPGSSISNCRRLIFFFTGCPSPARQGRHVRAKARRVTSATLAGRRARMPGRLKSKDGWSWARWAGDNIPVTCSHVLCVLGDHLRAHQQAEQIVHRLLFYGDLFLDLLPATKPGGRSRVGHHRSFGKAGRRHLRKTWPYWLSTLARL